MPVPAKPPSPVDPLNPTLDESYARVLALVHDFRANENSYLAPTYQEAQVRKDFIDKFLTALGWDVSHDLQKNPFQQEAKVEHPVTIATAQKRADYALSLAPHFDSPVLYIEAKKPAGELATPDNYFQTIRYAYQKSHPVAVLTDFAQLHLLDARFKPNIDTAIHRALRIYHYHDYAQPETFAEIYYLLSRPAVLAGALSAYAEKMPKPTGRPGQKSFLSTAYLPFDEALLEELDEHRKTLARALKNRNPDLDSTQLTELTQRILDRLVFIRFLEDKLIEPDHLVSTFGKSSASSAWQDFLNASRRLNKTYNGIVFKYHPQLDDPASLAIDDKPFADLLDAFDHTKTSYLFSDIPIHILGSIYERFLGNVITATAKRADLEPKPEVRKAGGVFYTPQYIVDYLVDNTVGKLIENKSPDDIAKLHFADIACGSGSFLLGVYDKLLKYHVAWYNEHPKLAPKSAVSKRDGVLHLTLEEKNRILLNNVYGVDIDPQAVEVAQLSLYLKLLEEETTATARQFTMDFKKPLLPSLAHNIKCGNSLISYDYIENKQADLLDFGTTSALSPFDWKTEFKKTFQNGGFDVILGNPPYVRSVNLKEYSFEQWDALRQIYQTASFREWDIYTVFIERALNLMKPDGQLGYIVPNKFMNSMMGVTLREIVTAGQYLKRLINFDAFQIFHEVTTYTCLLFLTRSPNKTSVICRYQGPLARLPACPMPEERPDLWRVQPTPTASLTGKTWNIGPSAKLEEKLLALPTLSSIANVYQGTGTRADQVYMVQKRSSRGNLVTIFSNETNSEHTIEPDLLHPVLRGRSIARYMTTDGLLLIAPYHVSPTASTIITYQTMEKRYPRTLEYLRQCKSRLDEREHGRFKKGDWYCYGRPQNMPRFAQPKLVLPDIALRGSFSHDEQGTWLLDTAYAISLKPDASISLLYLLAILNSRLLTFFLKTTGTPLRGGYFRMKTAYLHPFPIVSIDPANNAAKLLHDKLAVLATQMLALHKRLPVFRTQHEHTLLQRQIAATDTQIDALVYQLYNLTPDEIQLVESAAPTP